MKQITITDKGFIPKGECVLNKKSAKQCLSCDNCHHIGDSLLGQPKKVYCLAIPEKRLKEYF